MGRHHFVKNGYAMVVSVLMVGAIGLTMAIVATSMTRDFYRTTFVLEQSVQARKNADWCAEQALQQIRTHSFYFGVENLNLLAGSCNYEVIDMGGQKRKIQASGIVGNAKRNVVLNIGRINPVIELTRWEEVADFN